MQEQDAIELITRIISKGRSIAIADISPTTKLRDDLGLDSLDGAELLAALHQETGKMLDAESLADFETVHSVARLLLASYEESHA